MILILFIVNGKPVEATRPLVVMKSNKLETAKLVSDDTSFDQVTPSEPNPCTYLPGPGNRSGCHH